MGSRVKKGSIMFNPLLFPVVFLLGYYLYHLKLASVLVNSSFELTFYVVLSMTMYSIGVLIGFASEKFIMPNFRKAYNPKISKYVVFSYLISISLFLLEYANCIGIHGTIPILSNDAELLRFEFPINGYIHLLAILNYPLLFVLFCDWFYYREYKNKFHYLFIIFSCLTSLALSLGLGGRGTLFIFLLYLVIALSFKVNFNFVKISIFGFLGIYILGLVKLVRDFFYFGPSLLKDVYSDWYFADNLFMMPLYFTYLGITMNYSVLSSYVIYLPDYHYGYFTFFKPFIDLIPGQSFNMIDLQYSVLNVDFHGELTSTILGRPYVDFGYFGSLVMLLLGVIIGYEFIRAKSTGLLRYSLSYGYLYAQVIMGVYTYTFGSFHVILYWVIIKSVSSFMDKRVYK